MLFISPRILTSNNTIKVAPIQFNYGVFPGSHACVSMLQPLGRTGMLGPLVLISEPLMQRLMPSRSRSWYTCHWFIWYSFQNSYIYIYKYSRGGFHTPTILVSNFNVLHRHSSCIPVCPNCHGRMIKAILACNVCFLCQVGMLVYYSCPSFGGGVAKAPCVSPDRCYLAHYYATNFHHSFIPQTPIYIIVSLSDEYEEVADEIPFRQIVL